MGVLCEGLAMKKYKNYYQIKRKLLNNCYPYLLRTEYEATGYRAKLV